MLNEINKIFNKIGLKNPLMKKLPDGTDEAMTDVCPFTVFGLFNKGITNNNRILIIEGLAEILGIQGEAPTSFDGIPIMNNMNAWFLEVKIVEEKKILIICGGCSSALLN